MHRKPSRFAELLNTNRPVVVVTEQGVEFDVTDATVDELVEWQMASLCRDGADVREVLAGRSADDHIDRYGEPDGWQEADRRNEEPSAGRADTGAPEGHEDRAADARAGDARSGQSRWKTNEEVGFSTPVEHRADAPPGLDPSDGSRIKSLESGRVIHRLFHRVGRGGGGVRHVLSALRLGPQRDMGQRNAPAGTRTRDARISGPTLYPLSYGGIRAKVPSQGRLGYEAEEAPSLRGSALLPPLPHGGR